MNGSSNYKERPTKRWPRLVVGSSIRLPAAVNTRWLSGWLVAGGRHTEVHRESAGERGSPESRGASSRRSTPLCVSLCELPSAAGVTTLEIKSGYGLELDTERRYPSSHRVGSEGRGCSRCDLLLTGNFKQLDA